MKRSLSRYITRPKRGKISHTHTHTQNQKYAYVSAYTVVELSTAVVKVDIEVINASLTQNQ